MQIRFFGSLLLLIISLACQQSASSRYEVIRLENDQISDLEKIRIFEENSSTLSGSAYAAVANLYANSGDYEAALETVHQAIVKEPMNSFYHTLKSNYAFELNDISTAYREALTAYQLGAKSLEQSLILAKMGVALSEYSIVNNIIDSLVLVYPNDPEVVFMAARKFTKAGQTGQAIDQYQRGIALDPERLDNYFYLAELYLEQENERSALKMLESFEIPAIESKLALLKAEAFERSDQLDSAVSYYTFLVTEKKDSTIYQILIDLYRENEMKGQLTDISVVSADSFPESKHFLKNAGEILDSRYKYDEALGYYTRLYELDTMDTLVADEISILQRKIAYLQRKREVERMENSIPTQGLTLPALDSLRKE